MAHVVVMPKLGNTVESCIIVKWNVTEGQAIKADTVLCEIETDKATMDVPAGVEGLLLRRLRNEGDDVPVLEPIALVGAAGEKVELPRSETTAVQTIAAGVRAAASPRAKAAARRAGVALEAIGAGSGPGGKVIERDVEAVVAAGPGLTAAALGEAARDIAVLHGLYEASKTGSGLGGRATLADLAAAKGAPAAAGSAVLSTIQAAFAQTPSVVQAPSPDAAFPGPYADTPIKSIRKIIADRMMHSLQSSAQLTLNASAPADILLSLRGRLKSSDPSLGLSGITIGDLVAFAASRVLAKYPKLNAHVVDGVVRSYELVHLGLAVDTPRGLMVPVVRDASSLSLRQFSEQSKLLAKSCVDGSPNPDLLSGSTFTVTNLGAFGIESFTPILNEPETGILGVNTIAPRATISPDGRPGVEMRIGFSLTVDHRIVDGADAARFLKDLADYIANIDIVMLAALM
ncbi:MAG: 2-oxo acid dehydrogenase subunit E2 [Spirochaetae bacterium HGW-Spirochaetae-9]|nr:MAG: 2-oxo acid dehydrogenase subunit E2 [Spirochaetae bacterium HGW-Spirochaetae-9]